MSDTPGETGLTRRTRFGVYGLAIDRGAILLARISDLVPGGVGKWTLPGGGMDWGETVEQTLRREMYEETGLVPTIGDLIHVRAWDAIDGGMHYHLLRAVYRVQVSGDPVVTEIDGSVDFAAWHRLDDLVDLPLTRLVTDTLEAL